MRPMGLCITLSILVLPTFNQPSQAKDAYLDSMDRGEFLLSQSDFWFSVSHDDRIDPESILDIVGNWDRLSVGVHPIEQGVIGVDGGSIEGPAQSGSRSVAMEIPPGTFVEDTLVTLERSLDPNTDPLAPSILIRTSSVGSSTSNAVRSRKGNLEGATIEIPIDLEEAEKWTLFPERDVKVVMKDLETGDWEMIPTTVDTDQQIAFGQIPIDATGFPDRTVMTLTVEGLYYGGYHQKEGFLVLSGENSGQTTDLNSALNPSPDDKILILVHGILSNAKDTWTESPEDFPNTLEECYDHIIYAQYQYLREDLNNYGPIGRKSASARASRVLWEDLLSLTTIEGRTNLAAAEVHLVGHSQGGVVSRWFVEEIPKEDSILKALVDSSLIDKFLSVDAPQNGVDFTILCEPFSRKLSLGNLCELLNSFDEERILGTSYLNRVVEIAYQDIIEVYAVSVSDDVIIPNNSALFLTEESQELSVNLSGSFLNLGHSLVHTEMATNGVGDQVKIWFTLTSNPSFP